MTFPVSGMLARAAAPQRATAAPIAGKNHQPRLLVVKAIVSSSSQRRFGATRSIHRGITVCE